MSVNCPLQQCICGSPLRNQSECTASWHPAEWTVLESAVTWWTVIHQKSLTRPERARLITAPSWCWERNWSNWPEGFSNLSSSTEVRKSHVLTWIEKKSLFNSLHRVCGCFTGSSRTGQLRYYLAVMIQFSLVMLSSAFRFFYFLSFFLIHTRTMTPWWSWWKH